jgi:uncharacterized protein YjbI with pentapeptide repeats
MTYQKPSSILASGNVLWNTWRRDYPDIQAFAPDLHAVDLHKAHLQGIDFHEADLRDAKLCRADLQGADLSHADVRGADLSGANVKKALLDQAPFDEANTSTKDRRAVDHDTLLEGISWSIPPVTKKGSLHADLSTDATPVG